MLNMLHTHTGAHCQLTAMVNCTKVILKLYGCFFPEVLTVYRLLFQIGDRHFDFGTDMFYLINLSKQNIKKKKEIRTKMELN